MTLDAKYSSLRMTRLNTLYTLSCIPSSLGYILAVFTTDPGLAWGTFDPGAGPSGRALSPVMRVETSPRTLGPSKRLTRPSHVTRRPVWYLRLALVVAGVVVVAVPLVAVVVAVFV